MTRNERKLRPQSFKPLVTPLIGGPSYVPLDPDKRLYKKTFRNGKRHCKSDQQSWQHIRGNRGLAKITVPSELEGQRPPPPIFADMKKRKKNTKRQSIDICPFKFLDLLPALNV